MSLARALLHKLRVHYHRLVLAKRCLDEPLPDPVCALDASICRASSAEVEACQALVSPSKMELFRLRLGLGDRCYVATAGDRIAYFGWMSFRSQVEKNSGVEVRLGQNEAYWFDCFTAQEFRNKGLHAAVTVKAMQECRKDGCRAVLTLVHYDNVFSRRGFRKVGFAAVEDIRVLSAFGWRKQTSRTSRELL